jgi:hypothetical protein
MIPASGSAVTSPDAQLIQRKLIMDYAESLPSVAEDELGD